MRRDFLILYCEISAVLAQDVADLFGGYFVLAGQVGGVCACELGADFGVALLGFAVGWGGDVDFLASGVFDEALHQGGGEVVGAGDGK